MKKILLVLFTFIAVYTYSQSEKYQAAMGATLQEYGAAKDAAALIAVESKFERIGDAEKTQWLPYYYAALIKAQMSFGKMGDPDKLADEAAVLIDKAKAIESNCETLVLEAMIATAKMVVNPQARYMEYGPKSTELLEKAKAADTTNPRPYVFQAQTLRNTPEAFGGGCANAKPVAQKALQLFETFKPAIPLNPNWGKDQVEKIVGECK